MQPFTSSAGTSGSQHVSTRSSWLREYIESLCHLIVVRLSFGIFGRREKFPVQ